MSGLAIWQEIGDKIGVRFEENYPVGKKCSYGTGGAADCAFFPTDEKEAVALTETLKERGVPFIFLGAGSNILVSDDGYRGAIISTERLKGITANANLVTACAGEKLSDLVRYALYNSLGGVEFLSGIPASVGGAVAMNAGCFGKTIGDYCVYAVSTDGVVPAANCGFGYRTSVFKERNIGVIAVCLDLENVEFEQSESKVEYFRGLRRNKQPKGRSCGSVFKNDGYYAGKVIESCGLKNARINGARVSEKHANFIIADETATSADIYRLIKYIKKKVENDCGIRLSEEVGYVGNFEDYD